jgi:hypothetical protein
MSFQERRPRRELGSSTFSGYRRFWRGSEWQPFLTTGSSLAKATASGVAGDIAGDQHDGPGVYELALSCRGKPGEPAVASRRIKVYASASSNVRSDMGALVRDGGGLRGFLDHALKEGHVVSLRVKPAKDSPAAAAAADKHLAAFDYAWLQQPGARARSLVVRQKYMCCGAIGTGLDIKEGAPKFVQPGKSGGGLLSMLSGKKR